MNIKNRIKKLESQTQNPANSDFCLCYENYWNSAIDSAYNENSNLEIEVYPKPNFEKSLCNMCAKNFNPKDISYSKICKKIYG